MLSRAAVTCVGRKISHTVGIIDVVYHKKAVCHHV